MEWIKGIAGISEDKKEEQVAKTRLEDDMTGADELYDRIREIETSISYDSSRIYSSQERAFSTTLRLMHDRLQQKQQLIVSKTGDSSRSSIVKKQERDKTIKANDPITEWFNKYFQIAHIVENELEFDELIMDKGAKEQTLLSAAEDLERIRTDLEEFATLSTILNEDQTHYIRMEKDICRLELQTIESTHEYVSLHRELESFIDEYNEIVNLASLKYIEWNRLIQKWENGVHVILKKA